MSIHYKNGCRDLLVNAMDICNLPMSKLNIAELGNQRLKADPGLGMRRMQSCKAVMQFFGANHVSFDWNGRDGAIAQDLSEPLDDQSQIGKFDIVTNFGTIEHVLASQYWAFRNAHELCKPGGLMVHAMPMAGTCKRHGRWHYTTNWFADLADRQSYQIKKLYEFDKTVNWPNMEPGSEIYVMAILKKHRRKSQKFMRKRRGWVNPTRNRRGR